MTPELAAALARSSEELAQMDAISKGAPGCIDKRKAQAVNLAVPFDESKHPRKAGKFAPKGTQTQGAQPKTPTTAQINPALSAQIRDFQKRMGLPVTGNFDAGTVAKIQAVRAATGGGGGKGKGGGKGGASKTAKAAAAAQKKQQAATAKYLKATDAAKAKAAKQTAAKQKAAARQTRAKTAATVSAVNALTPAQRAAYRARNPAPAGYAWTAKGTLAAVSTVAAQKQVAATLAHH